MTESASPEPEINALELLHLLRRKEGTWVEWGKSCQQLQKAGYTPQGIFEETGFEPIQQNQIIAAAQVYTSLIQSHAPENVLAHFEQKGSDSLYELRILTQSERAAVAELLVTKSVDSEGAREVAKAVKELSRMAKLPDGFSSHPGDAVAYQCWKLAQQKEDIQERTLLIVRGLRFVHSETARQQVEKLLTNFRVASSRPIPRLPIYRLESEVELPRILPVAGKLPLTKADLQAVPLTDEVGPFRLVASREMGWVAVPGWQVVLKAEDPVAILSDSKNVLPDPPQQSEEVLVVIDRAQRVWNADSYFVVELSGQLVFQCFEAEPNLPLLGRIIIVMRPKRVLDEDATKELWQIDE